MTNKNKQLFLVRNIANITLTEKGNIVCAVRMIITHDKKLYAERKDKRIGEYKYCRLQPRWEYDRRPFQEINKNGITTGNCHITGARDFERIINNELNWILEQMYKRSTKTNYSKRNDVYRVDIDFYNEKRIQLNKIQEYVK